MAEKAAQSYNNHKKYVPLYHYVLVTIVTLNLLWKLWGLVSDFSFQAVVDAAMAFCFMAMTYYLRVFPLTAQDRLIRLEETLRMQRLLPAELQDRIGELRRRHFVALRFASDGELADLVSRVLDG